MRVVELVFLSEEDEELVNSIVSRTMPSYSLESKLGDCKRAAEIHRLALKITTGQSLSGLPLDGFDYNSILGQCCEMVVGYVQIPVRIAGSLVLDGVEYSVPMATTEGCLVASTNRGCKAIYYPKETKRYYFYFPQRTKCSLLVPAYFLKVNFSPKETVGGI